MPKRSSKPKLSSKLKPSSKPSTSPPRKGPAHGSACSYNPSIKVYPDYTKKTAVYSSPSLFSSSLSSNLMSPQLGGRIDPDFITSYNEIRDSGITNIDGYFFPCTGYTHNCKSPQTQVNEIVTFLKANKILVKRLWLDLEPPNPGSRCKGWDYGAKNNTVLAKEFVAAIKATGLKWGVVRCLLLSPFSSCLLSVAWAGLIFYVYE